jgi:hypothetical protein
VPHQDLIRRCHATMEPSMKHSKRAVISWLRQATGALVPRRSACGDRRHASINLHDTLLSPSSCPLTSPHRLTCQCPRRT